MSERENRVGARLGGRPLCAGERKALLRACSANVPEAGDEHRNHSKHRNTIEGRSIYVHKDRHQEVWTV